MAQCTCPRRDRLLGNQAHLKQREAPRYARLAELLQAQGLTYEFEIVVGDGIFDLGLPQQRLLVEFSGVGHTSAAQHAHDWRKARTARELGWTTLWVPLDTGGSIPTQWVYTLLELGRHTAR